MYSSSRHFGLGLESDTVELAVKTLLSHLIARKFNSPVESLQMAYVRVEPYTLRSFVPHTLHHGPIDQTRVHVLGYVALTNSAWAETATSRALIVVYCCTHDRSVREVSEIPMETQIFLQRPKAQSELDSFLTDDSFYIRVQSPPEVHITKSMCRWVKKSISRLIYTYTGCKSGVISTTVYFK
eukprot:2762583-Pyramimonas_sp.AAC.1